MKTLPLLAALLVVAVMGMSTLAVAENPPPAAQQHEINYADAANWVKISDAGKEVDVFYLYPTCWMPTETDGVVNTIDNKSMRESAPVVYAEQASCFEGVANIYVPFYRQLNAMKSLSYSLAEQEKLVADVPYHDALAAFEYYLAHYNNGRPFILAGHSQGSNVLMFLLSEYMARHPEVYSRMVAAYALDYSYSQQYFQANPHLKFAEGETDTQVVISWNCEFMKDGRFSPSNLVCHKGALSINPVSRSRDNEKTEAGDSRNLGALDTRERYDKTNAKYKAQETRFYISSLHNVEASQFARWIRAHWGIENQLHWVLDMAFNEDASQKRAGNSAENFSRLLRFARNILKRYKDTHPTKLSYRSMKFKAALQEDFALEVLKAVFGMTCFA